MGFRSPSTYVEFLFLFIFTLMFLLVPFLPFSGFFLLLGTNFLDASLIILLQIIYAYVSLSCIFDSARLLYIYSFLLLSPTFGLCLH